MAVDGIKQKIEAIGYDLTNIELDDGVFKVRIVDRQSGLPVKANEVVHRPVPDCYGHTGA
ncbi:hypothetical protein ABIA94_009298 [Bradyrhizobium sp. LA7.1]